MPQIRIHNGLSASGNRIPPIPQRVFVAVCEGKGQVTVGSRKVIVQHCHATFVVHECYL